ncbi:MAG: pitrilysin family protein [Pseudomonadota bacterium]
MKFRVFLALCCGAASLASVSPHADAQVFPDSSSIVSRDLPNGLRVIVWPDHDIPNVAFYNWVRAGGRNEVPGITGLSHFFEHMMFNGTSTLAPGEFDRIMEASGGRNNAYTSNDVTVYQDWFPASALEIVLELEADRLSNLSFAPEVVESERGVVASERRSSVDNNNPGLLYEQVQATAFVAHPYQFPVIGWPSDIESWELDDLKSFFKRYYAPNNCTMVIVGDVQPDAVFAMVERLFGEIPAQEPPPAVRTAEPEQTGERRLVLRKAAQTPLLQLAYKSPEAGAAAGPALDLLLSILIDGDSSRLHQVMVDQQQLAVAVSGFRHEGFDPGLTWFFVTLPQGGDVGAAEQLLRDELARVAQSGVTDAELQKARNIVSADFWRGLSTIDGKASALGQFEVFHGGYAELFNAPARYEAVSAEDIQAVARQVFTDSGRTTGVLLPLEPPAQAGNGDGS